MTFREDVRAFLERAHPGPPPGDRRDRFAWQQAWASHLVDEGWAAPSWPVRFGGMDLPPAEQVVYHEEFARARVPPHPCPVTFILGPTLIVHGSEDHQRHLRPLLRGETMWCQGFSEPEAGSDLTSLRTRAVLDGDEYVVSGQKVWTTAGHHADWMFALVRTGGTGAGGLSYLLIDLRSPGVLARPLRAMSGGCEFAEVFLDEVRVPVANLVGEEDGGWAIARTSLGHERATAFLATQFRFRRVLDDLVARAQADGRSRDGIVRQELVRLETSLRLLTLNGERALRESTGTGAPGPSASVSRLLRSSFEQRLHELAVDLSGPSGMLAGGATHGFLRSRAASIGAGTSEVQRTTIAEKVLGLPSDG
jgi:alkylation response protein AidB-like acyl-CoA dehydrogenase